MEECSHEASNSGRLCCCLPGCRLPVWAATPRMWPRFRRSSSKRSYNGSASIGDFLAITLDPVALTLAYKNLSKGDTGVVPYTVNADGTYALNDPNHNFQAANEVPNYALLLQAAKAGPKHNALALVTAVQKSTISIGTWADHDYHYMQFRTSSGGVEVGSISLDAQASISLTSYWPYGAGQGRATPFM
jgi:hypothetical protein